LLRGEHGQGNGPEPVVVRPLGVVEEDLTCFGKLVFLDVKLVKGLLDLDLVVAVDDGVDDLDDIGGEPGPLFPLLRLQSPNEAMIMLRRIV